MEEEVVEDEDFSLQRHSANEASLDSKLKTSGRHFDQNSGEMSLRQWLDKPNRPVNYVECLHIFRQVVEAVNHYHSQGLVANSIWPSCFVLSTFNRVFFTKTLPVCSDSFSGLQENNTSNAAAAAPAVSGHLLASMVDAVTADEEWREFLDNSIMNIEKSWYASPEETEGQQSTFSTDMYKLGVLLFELFCMFETMEEKKEKMSNLRERVLPPQMLLKWPKEASFCLWLLHPHPTNRLTMRLEFSFIRMKLWPPWRGGWAPLSSPTILR